MNTFWQHTGYLAKSSLDSFSGIGDEEVLPRLMGKFGVALSGYHKVNIRRFFAELFIEIIGIPAIAVQNAVPGKVKEHVLHAIDIVVTARKHGELDGYTVHCCDYLYREPIKVFSHGSFVSPVLLPPDELGAADADIFARGHGKTVNNIFRRYVQSFYYGRGVEKQIHDQPEDSVYPSVKTALAEHPGSKSSAPNKIYGVIDVAMKIFGGDQSDRNQLRIRRIPVNRFFMPDFYHDVINKNVNCDKFIYHILQIIWFGDLNLGDFYVKPQYICI